MIFTAELTKELDKLRLPEKKISVMNQKIQNLSDKYIDKIYDLPNKIETLYDMV